MTDQEIKCPECGGLRVQRYGKTPAGEQRYRCMDDSCGRQFVPGADHLVDGDTKALVIGMIKADVHPRKIYQAVNPDKEKISLRWIYQLARRMKAQNDR